MTRHTNAVSILMYHKVGYPCSAPRDAFLNIPHEAFRRQMQALARLGYQARTFAEVADAHASGRRLPRRTCVITFDDGYRCVGESAVPILAEFGWPATVFVVSDCVGATNAWDRTLGHPELPLMGWEELRQLSGGGWEIGGHTRTHRHLGALTDGEAYQEIADGKAEAEARMGITLHT
ncbi:MAG: polysaccharide deacetylase family protein, partial [Armatimonadota bacterium]|nr:polysaccharide deacetylase family protein [Armatimonadota bacterium]